MKVLLHDHLLTLLLAIPLLTALAILFIPRHWLQTIRRLSVGSLLLTFACSLLLIPEVAALFDTESLQVVDYAAPGFHFVEAHPWVSSFGIQYKLGIDGLSLWLVILTTLLTPIALYASWTSVSTKIKEYAISFLLLQVGMLGAFFALDLFLFYVFWELMLVPMYLIIGIWGGKERVYAAVKFFLYTMVGSFLMLVAILWVVFQYESVTGHYSFDLEALRDLALPPDTQLIPFLAFILAFAIKVPMFPVHTWLPDAHVQAPTGGSVVLAAVLLKLGAYGFLRFAMPLFPNAAQMAGPTIAAFGIAGIIYGAFCAWRQRDLKKLVAYSSVAHMGYIALGIFALTPHGVNGAILQMVNHGVSTGALFILVGVIYERAHTRNLDEFGGIVQVMPWYAVVFIIITMSSIGLPSTNGFVGEFLIMSGTYVSNGNIGFGQWSVLFAILAATGVILAAIYMLHAVMKMFWGKLGEKVKGLPDLTRREWIALAPLILLVFWIGVFPNTFLKTSEPAVRTFITDFRASVIETASVREPALRHPELDVHHPLDAGAPAGAEVAEDAPLAQLMPSQGAAQ